MTLSKNVVTLSDYAFSECSELKSVTIPDSVTSIGDHSFSDCTKLNSLSLGQSVASIGSSAFYLCTSVASFDVGQNNNYYTSLEGVLYNKQKTSLLQYPPAKQDSLLSISASVTSIESTALYNCPHLACINVSVNNYNYQSDECVLFNKGRSRLIQYPAAKSGNYTVPSVVTTINAYAFYHSYNLTSVVMGSSVSSIGSYAFAGCRNLKTVAYKGYSDPGYSSSYVFDECYSLMYVCVPSNYYSSRFCGRSSSSLSPLSQCGEGPVPSPSSSASSESSSSSTSSSTSLKQSSSNPKSDSGTITRVSPVDSSSHLMISSFTLAFVAVLYAYLFL